MKLIKQYSSFIKENMNQAKSIIKKKMDAFENLKSLLKNNVGYIGKFTEYLMNENVPFEELKSLYNDLLMLKEKSYQIDISGLSYEKVLDKIQEHKNDISVNSLISKFPSAQKSIARECIKDEDKYYNMFLELSRSGNIDAFISKISRYKDRQSLLDAIKIFAKDSVVDKDKVIEMIEKLPNSKIIFDKNNILICKVGTWEDIKVIGSNTSWCIVSSQIQWNSYTKGRLQYVLYNFSEDSHDPKFKIGFTLNVSRDNIDIYAAHDILDRGCSQHLRALFNENSISKEDFYTVEKFDPAAIDKITLTISNEKLETLCKECDREDIPRAIKKILSLKKSNSIDSRSSKIKQKGISLLVKRYFQEKPYILESDLSKIDSELTTFIVRNRLYDTYRYLRDKFIIANSFDDDLSSVAFNKALDIWSDETILNNIWARTAKNIIRLIDDEVILKFSNRLNDMYRRKDKLPDEVRGMKLVGKSECSNLELNMIVLNSYLKRIESTPDYETIIKKVEYESEYKNLLPTLLDLNKLGYRNLADIGNDEIPKILKKDYTDPVIFHIRSDKRTSFRCVNKIEEILVHLDGHKLNLSLTASEIRYLKKYKEDNKESKGIVYGAIDKLPFKGLKTGTSATNGPLTITVKN